MDAYVNQFTALMQKIIIAATPVAKKAWEISMLTLQIDALAAIIPMVGGLVLSVVLYKTLWKRIDKYIAGAYEVTKYGPFDKGDWKRWGMALSCVLVAVGVSLLYGLMNVWLWVKLFQPELWLAHMAIEKLIK